MRRILTAPALIAATLLVSPAWGDCPLHIQNRQYLASSDFTSAKGIIVAKLLRSSPLDGKADGISGTSEWEILRVLRPHALIPHGKITLDRHVSMDPKDHIVIFFDVHKGKLDPFKGRIGKADSAYPQFVVGAPTWKENATPRARAERLPFFFGYFEHPEEDIANEAFNEWAYVSSAAMAMATRRLPAGAAAKLRGWVKDAKTPRHRVGLYAFLLGLVSDQPKKDADLIKSLLVVDREKSGGVFYQGLMAGYLQLVPGENTWKWFREIVSNPNASFVHRYSALQFLQFQEPLQPLQTRRQAIDFLAPLVDQDDITDIAIEQLRKWQLWAHTDKILDTYWTEAAEPPIVAHTIIRYALVCPHPSCSKFIDDLRRRNPELIQDMEELLKLENGS